MTEDEQLNVYKSVRRDVWNQFGQDALFIAMAHNCMEVSAWCRTKKDALMCR